MTYKTFFMITQDIKKREWIRLTCVRYKNRKKKKMALKNGRQRT